MTKTTSRWKHFGRRALCGGMISVALTGVACMPAPEGVEDGTVEPYQIDGQIEEHVLALKGSNESGYNLSGSNLAGSNLAGTNLAGANLGGNNLAGNNLGGSNLGGSNLGGNNLGGNNLGGSNLGGSNLGGNNLGGNNLGGSNLGGSNLAGSNLGGSNLGGNNLAGTNLAGSNLAGSNTGRNIHNLAGAINGMLYSAEDLWTPKTAQCIVMGIGSTAFAKLLGQQSVNAKISVALGKLPWGFAQTSGGAVKLGAWEAIVWGDKTYCSFVLAVPPGVNWAGVAGFIKAVFRWNTPPTQTMEISGIEAARTYDSTTSTVITSYTGMMNAAAKFRAGTITAKSFVAGELALITATTNNQSVMVDFSAWVLGSNNTGIILANVESVSKPTYVESVYYTVDNGDGTVAVKIHDGGFPAPGSGVTWSNGSLGDAYNQWQIGYRAAKPVPRRCAGALYLNWRYGVPVPAGKCDSGLAWASGSCTGSGKRWNTVSGTTAPFNAYMEMPLGGSYPFQRGSTCPTLKNVLADVYVHLWERNYD
jgi:hypothetical protein